LSRLIGWMVGECRAGVSYSCRRRRTYGPDGAIIWGCWLLGLEVGNVGYFRSGLADKRLVGRRACSLSWRGLRSAGVVGERCGVDA